MLTNCQNPTVYGAPIDMGVGVVVSVRLVESKSETFTTTPKEHESFRGCSVIVRNLH